MGRGRGLAQQDADNVFQTHLCVFQQHITHSSEVDLRVYSFNSLRAVS